MYKPALDRIGLATPARNRWSPNSVAPPNTLQPTSGARR